MATITYKLSNKIGKDGKSQIFARVRPNRNTDFSIPTNVWVSLKHFEVTSSTGGNKVGDIKVPKRSKLNFAEIQEAQDAKNRLQDFTNKLLKVCEVIPVKEINKTLLLKCVDLFGSMSVTDITYSNLLQRIAEAEDLSNKKGFFDYRDAYLKENKFADSRFHSFDVLMRTLHRWQEFRKLTEGNGFTIELDGLTADDVQDFREYIENEYLLQEEYPQLFAKLFEEYPPEMTPKHKTSKVSQRGENTIVKFLKFFKTYWMWLMKEKCVTNNNPFDGVRIGTAVYGVPYYLTIEERNKVAEFDLSAREALAIQRDIFVFQCLIGCRVSDLYKLTEANITNGILEYVPIKTKDNSEQVKPRVPLNDRAKDLVEKYKGKDSQGRLFPYISTQKYNEAIKEVLKVCGIDRNVQVRNSLTGDTEVRPIYEVASSHMARRTFVGTAYSKVQDPNLIGKMSGHVEGSRAFARYRAIDDELLKGVIDLID